MKAKRFILSGDLIKESGFEHSLFRIAESDTHLVCAIDEDGLLVIFLDSNSARCDDQTLVGDKAAFDRVWNAASDDVPSDFDGLNVSDVSGTAKRIFAATFRDGLFGVSASAEDIRGAEERIQHAVDIALPSKDSDN